MSALQSLTREMVEGSPTVEQYVGVFGSWMPERAALKVLHQHGMDIPLAACRARRTG